MNQNTTSQKPLLPLRKYKGAPKVILSNEIIGQINTLHSKIGSTEWSGVLLYKVLEGDITTPDNLVIKCIGLFLMDIGTSAYTEFDTDVESIIELSERYPEYEEGKLLTGLIHTHHNMSTRPSKTDDEELQENAPAYNAYLSLIVNFSLDPSARIAFVVEDTIEHRYEFNNIKGKKIVAKQNVQEKIVMYYDCDVSLEYDEDESLIKRIESVKEKKKKVSVKTTPRFQGWNDDWDDIQSYSNKKSDEVLKTTRVRSFLCKLISLNETYIGSDLSTCINRMNSAVFQDKKVPVKTAEKAYREVVEDMIVKVFDAEFGRENFDTDDDLDVFSSSIELLTPYKSFFVARCVRDLFLEYIGAEEDETNKIIGL